MRMGIRIAMALAGLAAVPAAGWAQTSGAIAGRIQDTTGAVLPGVTVEAVSPALIEKVRAVVTDTNGEYMIVELRPGTYSVTFSLPGFAGVTRKGIELNTGFTATVNAELKVGEIEETITVSGAAPAVDLRNVSQARVMTREIVDLLPTGKLYSSLAELIPGMIATGSSNVTRDLGGNAGNTNNELAIHGGRTVDQQVQIDGMPISSVYKVSSNRLSFPDSNVEETSLQYSAHTALDESGGVYVKLVPKSGSNTFAGWMFANFTNSTLQANNVSEELVALGVGAKVKGNERVFDINPAFGGPIRRDRLWFFVGVRRWDTDRNTTFYPDSDPSDWKYTPDFSQKPTLDDHPERAVAARITWQASRRNTINVNVADTSTCQCHWALGNAALGGVNTADASQIVTIPYHLAQVTWSAPMTNRWLYEAGGYAMYNDVNYDPRPTAVYPAALELNGLYNFRARPGVSNHTKGRDYFGRGSVSRVTGAHASKIGMTLWYAGLHQKWWKPPTPYHVTLLNGVPRDVSFHATPYSVIQSVVKGAVFAQDQWTLRQLTVNAGLRFDVLQSGYPDVHLKATDLLPARDFPGASVLRWRDLSPRLGIAYNLLGNDKTVLKVSVNRYVIQEGGSLTSQRNPANSANGILKRAWNDVNGDYIPQGDPLNPAANGELGRSPNSSWGQPRFTSRVDPALEQGWSVRPYQWELSAGVQHELAPRVSAGIGYFRRLYGNFNVADNVAVAPTDYDSYCITAPVDERLPRGSGQQICGLYDLKREKVGPQDNLITHASNYGRQYEHFDGVDLTMSARLPNDLLLQGGMSTGKTMTDNCDVVTKVDNPSTRFCHVESPFLTQVKFVASYMLPWAIQIAATYQNMPSAEVSANYVATNAVIEPSLGRPLSAGANSTVIVNLVEPTTTYRDRLQQVDLRLARTLYTAGRTRIKGMVDIYNLLNANTVLVWNNGYGTNGASWLRPQDILGGQFVKFGMQMDF